MSACGNLEQAGLFRSPIWRHLAISTVSNKSVRYASVSVHMTGGSEREVPSRSQRGFPSGVTVVQPEKEIRADSSVTSAARWFRVIHPPQKVTLESANLCYFFLGAGGAKRLSSGM